MIGSRETEKKSCEPEMSDFPGVTGTGKLYRLGNTSKTAQRVFENCTALEVTYDGVRSLEMDCVTVRMLRSAQGITSVSWACVVY